MLRKSRKTELVLALAAIFCVGSGQCAAQENKDWLRKKSSFRSLDADAEQKLFMTLPQVSRLALKPGDILLKKDYRVYEGKASPVINAQKAFRATRGSKFTTHAILYIGNGRISESIADNPGGVWNRTLDHYGPDSPAYKKTDGAFVLVYRCQNETSVQRAIDCAQALAQTGWVANGPMTAKITYSMKNCMGAFIGNSREFGTKAKNDATNLTQAVTGSRPIAFGSRPLKEMMCSEFVSFCFQNGYPTHPVEIALDAHRTAPIRLEEYLNTHGNFALLGRIGWNQ
ncbi:MAG: hypothetical protein AAF483_31205 [Planctomycetota bacterium]